MRFSLLNSQKKWPFKTPKGNVISDDVIKVYNSALFLRPLSEVSTLDVLFISDTERSCYYAANVVVVASLDSMELKLKGDWYVEVFPVSQVATLIAFVDSFTKASFGVSPRRLPGDRGRSFSFVATTKSKGLIHMVVNGIILDPNPDEEFLSFIRTLDSYRISLFLLSFFLNEKDGGGGNVQKASKVYGLSETCFRKQCVSVFGRGPNKQIRLWRAASSVLQLMECDGSVVTIACANGYSSSSHFSSEIKAFFGMTPKGFKNLEGVFNEHHFQ